MILGIRTKVRASSRGKASIRSDCSYWLSGSESNASVRIFLYILCTVMNKQYIHCAISRPSSLANGSKLSDVQAGYCTGIRHTTLTLVRGQELVLHPF